MNDSELTMMSLYYDYVAPLLLVKVGGAYLKGNHVMGSTGGRGDLGNMVSMSGRGVRMLSCIPLHAVGRDS